MYVSNIVKCPSCSYEIDFENDEIRICDNDCKTIICNNCNKDFYIDINNVVILGHSSNCGNDEYDNNEDLSLIEPYNSNENLNITESYNKELSRFNSTNWNLNSKFKSRLNQMETIQKEGFELFKKKNADYGDAFAKYGIIGVLMRIEDKIQRSLSITNNGVNLVKDENIRDTLLDLHNYAAMGLMLLDEE